MNRPVRRLSLMTILITAASLATSTLTVNLMKVNTMVISGVRTELMVPAQEVKPGDTPLQRATLRTATSG